MEFSKSDNKNELLISFRTDKYIAYHAKEFEYIDYIGEHKVEIDGLFIDSFIYRVKELDDTQVEIMQEFKLNKHPKQRNIKDILYSIAEIYSISRKKINEKLLGDIGEMYSIIKIHDHIPEVTKYFQVEGREQFDFNFNGLNVDVKTTGKKTREMKLNRDQFLEPEKEFIIVEFLLNTNGKNIFDLIDIIKEKSIENSIILEIEEFWKKNKKVDALKYRINYDSANISFFDIEYLPIIEITQENSLKTFNLTLNTSHQVEFGKVISRIKENLKTK